MQPCDSFIVQAYNMGTEVPIMKPTTINEDDIPLAERLKLLQKRRAAELEVFFTLNFCL